MTDPYWFMFLMIGGSGATFGLCIVLLTCKSKQLKTVGKLGIVPAFFNINEPVIFGVPLMLNPMMYIPFVGAVLVNCVISYGAMYFGLVGRTIAQPGWNMFLSNRGTAFNAGHQGNAADCGIDCIRCAYLLSVYQSV